VGNRGYRKYLKILKDSVAIDAEKIEADAVFAGKWVLITNTGLSGEQIALKEKVIWRVGHVFRDVKCLLETRLFFHQNDAHIVGRAFFSFLALVLQKVLDQRLSAAGHQLEWLHIKQNLEALKQVVIEENGQRFALRSECR
jgi:hypothetical protein